MVVTPRPLHGIFIFFIFFIIILIIFLCLLILYLFLLLLLLHFHFHTHNYMNCNKSAEVHPAKTMLGHTLVTLRSKGHYEGAQVHPVFLTGAQRAKECQP